MKCPFVDRDCIGRECAGWSNGICFVENFTQKLDTLSNLISRLSFDLANRASLLEAGPGESKTKTGPTEKIGAELEEEETTKISSSSWQPISAPVSVGESILAVDFGTALSKVAIRPISQNRTIPVPLAEVAGKILDSAGERTYLDENRFVQDSIIYIDDDSKVLCGSLAKSRYIEVSNYRRDAIQNLKQFLIGGGTKVTLQDSYFRRVSETMSQTKKSLHYRQ